MNAQVQTLSQLRPGPVIAQAPEKYSVGLTDSQGFELAQRAAKLLASSSLVPKEYQGNIPNCVIALNMAQRVGADPLMVMQNLVIVHGKPTWSSQFLIATVNTCGRFSALRYEFFGKQGTDEWGCRAWAVEKATGEKLVGTDVTIAISKKEGWFSKNGSKWQSIPQQMLMYRAGSWWTRAYAPELSMGLHTADEMRDVYDAGVDEDGAYVVTAESLRTASSAPATADTGSVIDAGTGEIISQQNSTGATTEAAPAQNSEATAQAAGQQQTGAPTFEDAMAAVKSGDIDAARDIARSLPEGQGKQIDVAIANRSAQGAAQSQQAAPTSRRRTGSGPSVE